MSSPAGAAELTFARRIAIGAAAASLAPVLFAALPASRGFRNCEHGEFLEPDSEAAAGRK
jgi:hypothetical protein